MAIKTFTSKEIKDAGSDAPIWGSSLKGYIQTTRSNIETIFGEPTWFTPSSDEKTTAEWVVEVDGVIGTIYDWKRYEMGTPAMDELTYWNIGGFSIEATDKIAEALGVTALSSNYPVWLHN